MEAKIFFCPSSSTNEDQQKLHQDFQTVLENTLDDWISTWFPSNPFHWVILGRPLSALTSSFCYLHCLLLLLFAVHGLRNSSSIETEHTRHSSLNSPILFYSKRVVPKPVTETQYFCLSTAECSSRIISVALNTKTDDKVMEETLTTENTADK